MAIDIPIQISEEALEQAATDMAALYKRNQEFYSKMERMFDGISNALDTPVGAEVKITGRDVLLDPIRDMNLILEHMTYTLNTIIGKDGQPKGIYYDKLFQEYEELSRIIKSKRTNA